MLLREQPQQQEIHAENANKETTVSPVLQHPQPEGAVATRKLMRYNNDATARGARTTGQGMSPLPPQSEIGYHTVCDQQHQRQH